MLPYKLGWALFRKMCQNQAAHLAHPNVYRHTVRKSQIVSGNSIFRKIQNSEFEYLKA